EDREAEDRQEGLGPQGAGQAESRQAQGQEVLGPQGACQAEEHSQKEEEGGCQEGCCVAELACAFRAFLLSARIDGPAFTDAGPLESRRSVMPGGFLLNRNPIKIGLCGPGLSSRLSL